MKVFLEISGGFSGLQLKGNIDTETLSSPAREETEYVLTHLQPLKSNDNQLCCDAETYHLRLENSGKCQQVSISVPSSNSQLNQILNRLKLEILQQKLKKQ